MWCGIFLGALRRIAAGASCVHDWIIVANTANFKLALSLIWQFVMMPLSLCKQFLVYDCEYCLGMMSDN
jgi:hypothetical protein